MATHGMIDLETLSTRPDATVLTVGAIRFDPYTNDEPHSLFDLKLDVDEQTALSRDIDKGTVEWWAKQPQNIQDIAFSEEGRISLKDFTKSLNKWPWIYENYSEYVENLKTIIYETAKFKKIKPKTMGQALRIDGITPAAVYILLSHLKRKSIKHIA